MQNKIIFVLIIAFLAAATVSAEMTSKEKISAKKSFSSEKLTEILVSTEPAEGNHLLYFYKFAASNIPREMEIKSIQFVLTPPKHPDGRVIYNKSIDLSNFNKISHRIEFRLTEEETIDIITKTVKEYNEDDLLGKWHIKFILNDLYDHPIDGDGPNVFFAFRKQDIILKNNSAIVRVISNEPGRSIALMVDRTGKSLDLESYTEEEWAESGTEYLVFKLGENFYRTLVDNLKQNKWRLTFFAD